MAEPMSAREAWEIVRTRDLVSWPVPGARYARACAIVEASVADVEAYDSDSSDNLAWTERWLDAIGKRRALQRGEDGGA